MGVDACKRVENLRSLRSRRPEVPRELLGVLERLDPELCVDGRLGAEAQRLVSVEDDLLAHDRYQVR